jgi:hypothetical protein
LGESPVKLAVGKVALELDDGLLFGALVRLSDEFCTLQQRWMASEAVEPTGNEIVDCARRAS